MSADIYTLLIVISPTLDQELASISTTLVKQKFSNVSRFTYRWDTATNAIEHLHRLASKQLNPQQIPQRKERVIVITEFGLLDMSCYDFLKRVKQIPSPPGYIHVAVVDPVFKRTRQIRCNQGGAEYYLKPMDTFQMELFKFEILRKEAQIQETLRIEEAQRQEAHRQEALRIQFEAQRQEAQRQEALRIQFEAQRQEAQRQETLRIEFEAQRQEPLRIEFEAHRQEAQRQEALRIEFEAHRQEALPNEEAQRQLESRRKRIRCRF